MPLKGVYVAATNQHVGKTTSTLGLVSVLRDLGHNVGYCKPVGQKFLDLQDLRVDKDTLLFADLLGFSIDAKVHSPVILGSGATSRFLDDPSTFCFEQDILDAAEELKRRHDFVVFEGTGHTGVGSVVNLSNADVARLLGLPAIMIVEGGIGRTLDRLNMSMALFREAGVPIVGVIVNKVLPEKLDKIEFYVAKKLEEWGVPLLGVLPYDKSLAYPIMSSIVDIIDGIVVCGEDQLERKVEDYLSGTVIDKDLLDKGKNYLLVVGADRTDSAVMTIAQWMDRNHGSDNPLSGIVATGNGEIGEETMSFVREHKVPLVRTKLDTLGSVLKISRIEVKINLHTPWKISRAIELIKEHVSLSRIEPYL